MRTLKVFLGTWTVGFLVEHGINTFGTLTLRQCAYITLYSRSRILDHHSKTTLIKLAKFGQINIREARQKMF